ncbi:MAG: redoxin family protein [Bacteriovoracia bacterium]
MTSHFRNKVIGASAILFLSAGLAAAFFFASHRGSLSSVHPKPLEDFSLLDHHGDMFELYRGAKLAESKAIVFISTGIGCPIVEKSLPKVQSLAEKYQDKKIQFVLVNSNVQDERADIVKHAKEFGIKLPILLDQSQIVADALNFDRTAEAVIVETKNWQIVYRGAIDDRMSYTDTKLAAKHEYLGNALDDFLANRNIRQAKTETMGCAISRLGWPKTITYYDHVAPILQAKCLNCHRPGGSPPQNLGTFKDARGWAAMIREVIRNHRMPLEHPDPYFAGFLYDSSLTTEEKGILVKWVDSGAQEGKGRVLPPLKYTILPPIRTDYVLGPITVKSPRPGQGPYVRSFLGVAPKDLWITAHEREFSNTAFIHHLKLIVTKKNQDLSGNGLANMEVGEGDDSSVIYLRPNSYQPEYLPLGSAFKIPKGHFIYMEQHLLPSGKDSEITTKIKLQLGDPRNLTEVKHLFIFENGFTIPPGAKNFTLHQEKKVTRDIELVRVMLHMHKRGQKITLSAINPDGEETRVFSIPKFVYNSNKSYILKPFVRIKAGTTLRLTGVYDNSDTNPNKIDTNVAVSQGPDPDNQEMLFAALDYQDAKPPAAGKNKKWARAPKF